jgi:hypothetical protein
LVSTTKGAAKLLHPVLITLQITAADRLAGQVERVAESELPEGWALELVEQAVYWEMELAWVQVREQERSYQGQIGQLVAAWVTALD